MPPCTRCQGNLLVAGLLTIASGSLHSLLAQMQPESASQTASNQTAAGHNATAGADIPASLPFSFAGGESAEEPLHMTVGQLLFLNSETRVRRIYIANPVVLDSYTISPKQIVITAKVPGVSSIVVWDENDQSKVYTVSCDVDVNDLRTSMKQALPKQNVVVSGRQGRVVLSGTVGTEGESDAAAKLAALFSKDVANSLVINPAKIAQVTLKVRIVEVDRSKLTQFGFNIFNPGGGSTIGAGTTSQFPTTVSLSSGAASGSGGTSGQVSGQTITISDPLNFLFYSAKANLGVTIKDLENKQILQILAEPTITTVSGQKANFLAGGEFPFPIVQGSTGGLTSVTIQFRPYGVKLEFTPVVNIDGTIALKVAPEVSALDYTNAVVISGYTIPALSTRRAETQVVLRSGQSFAISGLLDKRTTDSFGSTPGISSIPVIGQLFRSKGVNLSTSELIVIVTPTVVDPLTDLSAPEEPVQARPLPTPQTFDKKQPASEKKP